jgi:hypothetical protein
MALRKVHRILAGSQRSLGPRTHALQDGLREEVGQARRPGEEQTSPEQDSGRLEW